MLPHADEAEQIDAQHIWQSLLWIPPTNGESAERDMLHLDDEVAGLIAAADMPAGQAARHSMKPEAAPSVPGEGSVTQSNSASASSVICYVRPWGCAVLQYGHIIFVCFASGDIRLQFVNAP